MTKRVKCIAAVLFTFVFATSRVDAISCDYEERAKLNNEVKNIKVNYEVKERTFTPNGDNPYPDAYLNESDDGEEEEFVAKTDYMQINILNLTENVYVEVSSDYEDFEDKIIRYSDTTDGNYSFDWLNIMDLAKLTFTVKASDETSCSGNELTTLTLQLPRYNQYSTYGICELAPDYYMCQRYVTYEDIEFSYFYEKVNKEVEKRNTDEDQNENLPWYQKTWNFIVEHKKAFIAGGIILVVAAGGTVVYIDIKRRRDEV